MARTALKLKHEKYSYVGRDIEPVQRRCTMLVNSSKMALTAICNKSGVVRGTIKNWETGKTRKPQIPTMNAVLKVLDYELGIVRRKR